MNAVMHRTCPDCFSDTPRPIGSIDAATIVRGNGTYRGNALEILGVSPDEPFDISACTRCGFVYAPKPLDDEFLARLYEQVIDPVLSRQMASSPSWVGHQLELASRLLQRAATTDVVRFLDYGCGNGTVVRAVSGPRVHATGFDPHSSSENATRSLEQVRMASPFDLILLSDVLEHVQEPRRVLAQCRELLAEGGWIAVSVPDFNPARLRMILKDLRSGGPVTPELNPWEHLNYFSPETLARMVQEEGFDVEPLPAPNFGFRNDTRGVRKAGNVVRSAVRLFRFAVSSAQSITTVFARRR